MKKKDIPLFERIIKFVSPKRAFLREAYRFSYNVLQKNRLNKKRSNHKGTGDNHLTTTALDNSREILRDLTRNNPIIRGLLQTETNEIIGSSTQIQCRTEDEEWNRKAEELWAEEMLNAPCDVSGRFNFHSLLNKVFYSYRRDGDCFVIFTGGGLQIVEGECIGTPAQYIVSWSLCWSAFKVGIRFIRFIQNVFL